MSKRCRNADSDAATAEYNTVFVDTSLDTHFAMLVSNSDTVSHFKKKMVLEHAQCFPKIGEIKIHCLKVKRKGNFYHLPDIMLVWSAFHGTKGNWFLSADASGTTTCHLNESPSELGVINGVTMDLRNADENSCRGLSTDVNMTQTRSEMITGFKIDKYLERATDYSGKNITGTESPVKKKRKVIHPEDLCHNLSLKDSCTLVHASGKDAPIPEIIGCGNSTVDAVKDAPGSAILSDQSDIGEGIVFQGTSKPDTAEKNDLGKNVNSQDLLGSDKRKEETLLESVSPEKSIARELECDGGQDIPTEQSGDFSAKVPDLSTGLMDASGAVGDLNSHGNKMEKKKSQKAVPKVQYSTDMEQIRNDGSVEPNPEAYMSKKEEEQKDLSLNCDREVIMPSKGAVSDLVLKEASLLQNILDKNATMELEISTGYKKKKTKIGKKSADTNIEKSDIKSTDNGDTGSSGFLFLLTDLIPEETDKANGILNDEGKSVQMKSLDSSTLDVNEKVRGANSDEADLLFTRAKQILENIDTEKTKMEKKTQSSVGDVNSGFPITEEENKILEFNQVEKDSKNTVDKDKKAKKRRKKRKHIASDLQEKTPLEDQNIGIEVLTTEGHSIGVVNSEQEKINATPSQVLSHESEDAGTGEQKMDKKTQSSVGNLAVEENQILEFKEVEKDNEKAKKKSKKRKLNASDVQEKLPVKDPKVGIEALTTEENSVSFVNSEQEGRNATSFQVTHGNENVETMEEEKVGGKTENAVGNGHADFPPVEEENQTVEFNQVDKYSQNTEIQEKSLNQKSQKKSRVKDKKAGIEALTTEGNPSSSVDCEEKGRNTASSKVMSHESKEKLGEMYGTVVNADNPARTSENEGEGINFKQFFVPSDKVEKATKSKDKVTTSRKVEQNGLPSVSISTESQKSFKSFNNPGSKNKRFRKDSGKGGSAQNSDLDEGSPNSSKRKNPSSVKSGSKISEKLPVKKGNRPLLGLNATNKTAMKTLRKKISLMKSGSIFQDNSGESSGGENGNLHLDGRHGSPSDSSSMSIGESDLSQDSAGNGSNDAKGRSTGGKDISALDLSASKDISMHMILRSSKRFKKAKLVASQNEDETEPIEFSPFDH